MTTESISGSNDDSSSSKSGNIGVQMEGNELPNAAFPRTETGEYTRLAEHMARHPELAIFRRFGAIGTEALLLQQAQLAALESRLRRVQADGQLSNNGADRQHNHAWEALGMSGELESKGQRSEQYDILKTIIRLKLVYGMWKR